MSFLMMAAHDTLTSSLTSFIGELAANPQWQTRLRDEVNALNLRADEATTFDKLEAMPLSEMAFKEAMRMKPPVPSIPRRATRDFTFKGYAIPAGTMTSVNPLFTHHMPEIWPDPDSFDPMRFTDEAQRAATVSPGCRSAAARICASGCISPICRRNVLHGISCKTSASRWSPATPRNGRCGRSRSRRTACG
jgi:cytochrome P450